MTGALIPTPTIYHPQQKSMTTKRVVDTTYIAVLFRHGHSDTLGIKRRHWEQKTTVNRVSVTVYVEEISNPLVILRSKSIRTPINLGSPSPHNSRVGGTRRIWKIILNCYDISHCGIIKGEIGSPGPEEARKRVEHLHVNETSLRVQLQK